MPLATSYMPQKQADQVAWASQFYLVVSADVAAYGVPAAQMTAFSNLNTALQEAWAAANNVTTRTKATVATKNQCLAEMKAAAKRLSSIIQGTAGVTDAMLINAGLTVRKTTPTPKPAPTVAPYVEVVGNVGRTVTIDLRQSKTHRGRPATAASATIFTYVGDAPPAEQGQWQFAMNTTQTTAKITFPPSATGNTAFITAFWSGTRGESGPAAMPPAQVNLPAGGVMPNAAAAATPAMKLRAA